MVGETLARFAIWQFGEFGIGHQINTHQFNLMHVYVYPMAVSIQIPKFNLSMESHFVMLTKVTATRYTVLVIRSSKNSEITYS